MAEKRKILVQLDSDPLPSLFDRIVAIDAGVDEVLSYGGIQPAMVRDLVHGAIFTRGPKDLSGTAFFIGGKDVRVGEQLFSEAQSNMLPHFGLQVSMMLDANGANTTATAAVWCIRQHSNLTDQKAMVLGAGPVGIRVALLLLQLGAEVSLVDISEERLQAARERLGNAATSKLQTHLSMPTDLSSVKVQDCHVLIGAGPTGKALIADDNWLTNKHLRVAVDLNAVPPSGLSGIAATDAGKERHGIVCFGPLGVGALKMKIHKQAIRQLFTTQEYRLDIEGLWALANEIGVQ